MPFNLLKIYNQHLELNGLSVPDRTRSLKGVFDRDFTDNQPIYFNQKQIIPCPEDGRIEMETLFRHLTTVKINYETGQRDFDIQRSKRLHWVRFHIDLKKQNNILVFSVKEPEGLRTYIYDEDEKYVVILEPKLSMNKYFLLTAYYLEGKDAKRDKIKKKYKRKLEEVL